MAKRVVVKQKPSVFNGDDIREPGKARTQMTVEREIMRAMSFCAENAGKHGVGTTGRGRPMCRCGNKDCSLTQISAALHGSVGDSEDHARVIALATPEYIAGSIGKTRPFPAKQTKTT